MSRTVNRNDQAGAVKGRTLEEVERDVAHCIDELQRLRGESDALPAQVEQARAALDSWQVGELERRGRELSRQVDELQAQLHPLYAERARLLLPEAEEKAAAAKGVYEKAHEEYLRAHRLTNQLGVECNNAQAQAHRLRQSIEEHERRARELTSGLAARPS